VFDTSVLFCVLIFSLIRLVSMPYRNSPNSTNWTNHDVDSYLLGRFRHFGGTRKSKLSVWRVLSLSFTSFAYNRVYVSILCSNSSRFVSALNYHKDELTFWDLSAVRNCVSCLLKTGMHFFTRIVFRSRSFRLWGTQLSLTRVMSIKQASYFADLWVHWSPEDRVRWYG
jgi:hypothetical protein